MLSEWEPDLPVGTIIPWNPAASIPPGWRPCDGRPIRRREFPDVEPMLRAAGWRTSRWPWARTRLPVHRPTRGVEYIIRVSAHE